jgi:hypothetical protein
MCTRKETRERVTGTWKLTRVKCMQLGKKKFEYAQNGWKTLMLQLGSIYLSENHTKSSPFPRKKLIFFLLPG